MYFKIVFEVKVNHQRLERAVYFKSYGRKRGISCSGIRLNELFLLQQFM
jgi:hypothetical protein